MKRVKLKFEKVATVKINGTCEVLVEDDAGLKEIYQKASDEDFVRYLPRKLVYSDELYNFDIEEVRNG
ncbi:hypothetical protein KGP36_03150 [Patescibacteria group bacterium]|nr:hypothetical protein [Patescibacteria group bacterium]